MSAVLRLGWAVAVACCVFAACSSSDDTTSPAEPTTVDATSGPATTPATTPTATTVDGQVAPTASTPPGPGTTAEQSTFGPGSFDLPDPRVGLATLAGYSASVTITFDGTRDGAPEQWTRVKTVEIGTEPPTRRLIVERTGDDAGRRVVVEVGGVVYEQVDDDPCTAVRTSDGGTPDPDDPTSALPGLLGADVVGPEAVGSRPATHYTFDERALGSLDPAEVTGDVWVADDGGPVLRYTFVADGTAAYFGSGAEGRLTIDYELTSTGASSDATAPPGCPPGLIAVETLADASEVINEPGYMSFLTSTPTADALEFYEQQLVAAGWTPVDSPLTTGDSVLFAFERAGELLTIGILDEPGGTTVTLVLTRGAA